MPDLSVAEFLQKNPKYIDILKRALEVEEQHDKDPLRAGLGWEWHEVRGQPASLVKLVVAGITKVKYKSNSGTMYLLVDRATVERALK
jgi:hypothetical protein